MKLKKVFVVFLLIFGDQLSKYLIRHFGGFYICNKNIAFGIKIPGMIFWIFWAVMIILTLYCIFKNRLPHASFFLLLVLSGAVSNTIDRLFFGCIIDFIDLKIWPIFNLADIFISAGVIIMLVGISRDKLGH